MVFTELSELVISITGVADEITAFSSTEIETVSLVIIDLVPTGVFEKCQSDFRILGLPLLFTCHDFLAHD